MISADLIGHLARPLPIQLPFAHSSYKQIAKELKQLTNNAEDLDILELVTNQQIRIRDKGN